MAESQAHGNVSVAGVSILNSSPIAALCVLSAEQDSFETVTILVPMIKLLLAIAAFSLEVPDLHTMKDLRWKPAFTEPARLQLEGETVAILTHCSQRFDPLRRTAAAVDQVVSTMKSRSLPVIYLHDKYNRLNPAWCYLYEDWNPTAYISSDVGNIDFKITGVNHVICLGGFFEQCERSTVTDLVRLWRRDNATGNFRITQVVDATFNVAAYVNFSDPYNEKVRAYFKQKRNLHEKAIVTLGEVLERIDDKTLVPVFLQRQLPSVPPNVNVVMDIFGESHVMQWLGETAPTLTFAYRFSANFVDFHEFAADPNQPVKRWYGRLQSNVQTFTGASTVIEVSR